ncbi:hypothetical protein BG015_000677 [Linnemannia schmuckeri]|uniref:Transmembrane protein 198 n=1 Tax=Linnemannia schmuckeri TaxID=64567 RepID=A0A9P5VE64_9FUNG|nr:hypothetical protein BG015_000677 [Linnemannia schmuckeri]
MGVAATTTNRSNAARLTVTLQILVLFMLPFLTLAQDPSNGNGENQPGASNDLLGDGRSISLTWQRIVGGFILILIGILLTFRGYRHYRFTMFLAGFIVGCVIVYSILANVEPQQGWNRRQIIYVFSCLGGGLLLGAICWLLNRFTIWILGGLAGLTTALYILAWRSQGLIRNRGGRIGLLVGASVVGMLLALVMGRRILIPATAIVGSYISVLGLDLFARTGFSASVKNFFTNNDRVNYRLNTNLYIMLGVIGGLIVLGTLFQMLSWRHRQQRLIAQGRSLNNHDNVWSLCGSRSRTVRPDPTYPNGSYSTPNGGYNNGYNGNHATTTYGNNGNTTAHVNEKKRWNPFKKSAKHDTRTTHTTMTNNYPTQDNRVSYSSNTALNQ